MGAGQDVGGALETNPTSLLPPIVSDSGMACNPVKHDLILIYSESLVAGRVLSSFLLMMIILKESLKTPKLSFSFPVHGLH